MLKRPVALGLCAALLLAGCGPGKARAHRAGDPHPSPPMFSYLGQSQVGFDAVFDGTVIGGLSAISYDPGRQLYYVISDDRSEKNPARFYNVRIALSDKGITEFTFP